MSLKTSKGFSEAVRYQKGYSESVYLSKKGFTTIEIIKLLIGFKK
jgi:hypothetical protein